MRPFPIVLLLVAAAASGCFASEAERPLATAEETRAAAAPQDEEPAAPEAEPAPSSPSPPYATPDAAEGASAPAALATLPLAFEGTTQTFVCVPSALPACGAALPSETERYVPEFEGSPRSVHVLLAWTPSTPLTQTLVLHVEGVSGCHEACHAMGPSPLELRLDDIALEEEWELTIHAFAPCQVCDGHQTMMDPGQDFSVSGELVYAPYGS